MNDALDTMSSKWLFILKVNSNFKQCFPRFQKYPDWAIAIPTLADGLDAIPVAGMYLNTVIDNFMVTVAGFVIANFILVLIDQVKGSD